ncbi:MAG: hypothetical protein U1C74_10870 [Phenylobacterium sp.]|nr:hypothetical protein [Phenylobacterium sp.]
MLTTQTALFHAPEIRALALAAGRFASTLLAYGLGIALVLALVLPAILAPLRTPPRAPSAPAAIPVIARTVPGGR